jgi:predicted metal-dependent HD superfamily phosphohydrolase
MPRVSSNASSNFPYHVKLTDAPHRKTLVFTIDGLDDQTAQEFIDVFVEAVETKQVTNYVTMSQWLAIFADYGLPFSVQEAQNVYAGILVPRYTETHRHYHTLDHINFMMNELNAIQNEEIPFPMDVHDWLTLELAIWFHDVIYDGKGGKGGISDEEASAVVAITALSAIGIDPTIINNVARLIRATESHTISPAFIGSSSPEAMTREMEFIELAHLLFDLDFAALGTTWDVYRTNNINIRKEYHWLTDEQWAAGRIPWLTEMSEREKIFTYLFWLEPDARSNMATERVVMMESGTLATSTTDAGNTTQEGL